MRNHELRAILANSPLDTLIMLEEDHKKYRILGHRLVQRNESAPPRYTLMLRIEEL